MRLYHGIVEDINDPLKTDRVRVRVYEIHTDDKTLIPTDALPWAQIMSDTRDASMSGIGESGSGLVKGSWVVLYFLDSDQQYPIIIGSLKGIPIDPGKTVPSVEEKIFNTSSQQTQGVLLDGSGNPVTTDYGAPVFSGEPTTDKITGARRARDFKSIGERGIILIQGSEGFRSNAYQDSGGIWTIGYGSTYYLDGTSVKQGDTITRERAAEIFAYDINQKFLPKVWNIVDVPVTQQMVDALTSLVYNVGSIKKSSKLITDLNSGDYELAASRFLDYNKAKINGVLTELPGLTARREREKNLFLSGGIPNAVGSLDEFPLPEEQQSTIPLEPLPTFDTETAINVAASKRGFSDPDGKYPLYRDEPDTSRLARHEKIVETIVYSKETRRDKDNFVAGTKKKKKWSQSPVPYNARYPNNYVRVSKSGHVMEFDDTPNSRRVHIYHASGSFIEIDDNGTQVNRIVGDGYEIIDRNGFIHIKGAHTVNIDGVYNLKVGGATNIDIDGKCSINVFNDVDLKVSGDVKASIKGDMKSYVEGDCHYKVDGTFAIDAKEIHLNSDIAQSLEKAEDKVTPDDIEFSELNVITRGTEPAMYYETPEEGDSTAYDKNRILKGETVTEELETKSEPLETETVVPKPLSKIIDGCGIIMTLDEFPPSIELSRHYTIGSFNKEGSRPIVSQMGLTKQQIACNLYQLAQQLDLVKDYFPHAIITSGFRRPGDVNKSSKTSQHYNGEAVDIQLPGYTRKEYLAAIKKIATMIDFDQLILEYEGTMTTWIHISVSSKSARRQLFTMNNHKRVGEMGELVLLA